DSARGQTLLDAAFPSTEANPTSLVFRLPTSVWDNPALLASAQHGLERSGVFRAVSGALDPNGGVLSPEARTRAHTVLTRYGPTADLPATVPAGVSLSAAAYNDYRASALFISADGRTIQYYATLVAGPSTSTAAAQAIPDIRAVVTNVGNSIGATAGGANGYAPGAADV